MTLHAWRIVKAKHAAAAFDGDGARRAGGRWNSRGTVVVYAAGSVSLAMLEMLVHLESEELLRKYVLFEVVWDRSLTEELSLKSLPSNWRASPAPAALQRIGDAWITAATSTVLRVPSALVPQESNFLLNPAHPDFSRLSIGPKQPIRFDRRLVRP